MLPAFDSRGNLPPGVHRAPLDEVVNRFGRGLIRERWTQVLQEVVRLAETTGRLEGVYLFGSFVTSKETPADLDIFLVMATDFSVNMAEGRAKLIFDRSRAAMVLRACVYWITARTDRTPFLEAWQRDRDGKLRGIVEVIR